MQLKPIQPKGLGAKFKALPKAVEKGMREAAEAVKRDLESTTEGWQHQVEFTITQSGSTYTISTDDEIWNYVDKGTRPHIIVGHGKMLRFMAGGAPKTQPGRVRSGSGSPGSVVVIRPRVNHPGTEARDFSGTIAKRWRRGVAPFIRKAIEEVLK